MAYTPLASVSDFNTGPFQELVRDMSPQEQSNLMLRASRTVESFCNRRLAPFTGLVETHRAECVDAGIEVDISVPLDMQGMLGLSRSQSLGTTDLVRHVWVREHPVRWPDLWAGTTHSVASVVILRAFSGTQTILDANNQWQYEPDTGHIRFNIGTFIPQGSTLQITYSGGYSPIPDELVQATILRAALLAMTTLAPQEHLDTSLLREEYEILLGPYIRGD